MATYWACSTRTPISSRLARGKVMFTGYEVLLWTNLMSCDFGNLMSCDFGLHVQNRYSNIMQEYTTVMCTVAQPSRITSRHITSGEFVQTYHSTLSHPHTLGTYNRIHTLVTRQDRAADCATAARACALLARVCSDPAAGHRLLAACSRLCAPCGAPTETHPPNYPLTQPTNHQPTNHQPTNQGPPTPPTPTHPLTHSPIRQPPR